MFMVLCLCYHLACHNDLLLFSSCEHCWATSTDFLANSLHMILQGSVAHPKSSGGLSSCKLFRLNQFDSSG